MKYEHKDTNMVQKMYQSSRFNNKKILFQEMKKIFFLF